MKPADAAEAGKKPQASDLPKKTMAAEAGTMPEASDLPRKTMAAEAKPGAADMKQAQPTSSPDRPTAPPRWKRYATAKVCA